jgi:hypothetical protein
MNAATTQPRERPILFSAPMVQAILAGRKTQTRRIVKPRGRNSLFAVEADGSPAWSDSYVLDPGNADWRMQDNRFGAPGDRLWVREAWSVKRREPCLAHERDAQNLLGVTIQYLAGGDPRRIDGDRATGVGVFHGPVEKGRPSIHMPRWASRITLEVTEVRVERLQDIGEADAIHEGALTLGEDWLREHFPAYFRELDATPQGERPPLGPSPRRRFAELWSAINGADSWASNPWVWVVGFQRVEA